MHNLKVGTLVRWLSDSDPATNIGKVIEIGIIKKDEDGYPHVGYKGFIVVWKNDEGRQYETVYSYKEFSKYMVIVKKSKTLKSWVMK